MKKIIILLFVLLCISSYSVYASNSNENVNEMIKNISTDYYDKQNSTENKDKITYDYMSSFERSFTSFGIRLLLIMLTGMIVPLATLIIYRKKFHSAFANRVLTFNVMFLAIVCGIICLFIINTAKIGPKSQKAEITFCIIAFSSSSIISTIIGRILLTEFDKNDDLLS